MEINFMNPGFDYSLESIMLFQNDETSNYWRDSLFAFYPQLDRKMFDTFDNKQKRLYLQDKLYEIYLSEEESLSIKAIQYNEYWEQHRKEVEDALSDAFDVDCYNNFNNINGKITLNTICPRFLNINTFDIFYKYSKNGALGVAIHEAIHFIWFNVWYKRFRDSPAEYETPSLKWIFSEAAVDAITRNDKRLFEKYPYIEYAYAYFYDIKIDGVSMLETLNDIYKNTGIIEFMEKGYAFFVKHEFEIRKHLQ